MYNFSLPQNLITAPQYLWGVRGLVLGPLQAYQDLWMGVPVYKMAWTALASVAWLSAGP